MFVFDKGHQISVCVNIDDKDTLPGVLFVIGVLDNIKKLPPFNVENDIFKGDTSFGFELFIFLGIPGEVFHTGSHAPQLFFCPLVNSSKVGTKFKEIGVGENRADTRGLPLQREEVHGLPHPTLSGSQ